ncbi:hypothetical protein BJ508DRAFT_371673 [Ascobolus immersus RN42]|uniref:Uncharacterized protein n=1 Tax=Ascobolus immersus RN42 TaxID=1160509 RepID=A0A3N4IPX0_ASCIM|nr:hypothetical protein BJ508DRAFT_371673 [Ascobolus immersus RN42]
MKSFGTTDPPRFPFLASHFSLLEIRDGFWKSTDDRFWKLSVAPRVLSNRGARGHPASSLEPLLLHTKRHGKDGTQGENTSPLFDAKNANALLILQGVQFASTTLKLAFWGGMARWQLRFYKSPPSATGILLAMSCRSSLIFPAQVRSQPGQMDDNTGENLDPVVLTENDHGPPRFTSTLTESITRAQLTSSFPEI